MNTSPTTPAVHTPVTRQFVWTATALAVVCIAWLGLLAQEKKDGKHLTAVEYKELVAKDPVLQFVERVKTRAVKNPIWEKNYALALYRAYGEETRAHLRKLGVESVESYEVQNP